MTDTILVPVDGSDYSRQALAVAATEFTTDKHIVLYVIDPFDLNSTAEKSVWTQEFMEQQEREAEKLLNEYEELAADLDISIQTELKYGSPARAIIGAADDFNADHIVIGSKGRSEIDRVLLGSVAETVVKRAFTSVTIVRPDQ
ncbi:universal stress protein [Halocatena marina]|uniref:universal stress protein n=1 Tax=Halocatena marina TaxID=2934937 RepID=UPI00200BC428|nr:universal stress protein [Halocatena marina]